MRFRLIDHDAEKPGSPGAAGTSGKVPEDLVRKVRQDFEKALMTYNLRGIDFEIHFFGKFPRIQTIAWTAGGKVAFMFERKDASPGSGFWLGRDADRQFLVFLMFHELGHNYWPPEHIIPIYAAGRLYQREGRPTRDVVGIVGEVVDILVNTHILKNLDVSKFFPDYTGRSLNRANMVEGLSRSPWPRLDVDDIEAVRRVWSKPQMPVFMKWLLYFYHDERLPVPNRHVLPLLKKMLDKRVTDPVWAWKDEWYPLWLDIIEHYKVVE